MLTSTSVLHRRARPATAEPRFYPLPRDGWLTLFLTVLIIYVTVVSVQSVQPTWADGLSILTPAMALGIALGYIATQQNLLPNGWMHTIATVLGTLGAFQLTANIAVGGNRLRLLHNTNIWFSHALLTNGASADNSVFLLFLTALTFLLAYMSMWLVFHARRPWLAVVANAVVLLINLNQTTTNQMYLLVIFLVLTLLLLVRFTLAENVRHWKRSGLRFSRDLGWDFMQAGAIFSVIVVLLPNLLPIAQPDPELVKYWSSNNSPVAGIEQRLQSLFSGVNGAGPGGVGFFDTSLPLVGNVNLPSTQVLHYTVSNSLTNDPTQYLVTEAFVNYDGVNAWTRGQTTDQPIPANASEAPASNTYHVDTYKVTFDATPTGGERYILAPGSGPVSFSIPSMSQVSVQTGEPVTLLAQHPLNIGDGYTATGYVSTASLDQLEAVPYPQDAAATGANPSPYPSPILIEYIPQEPAISPQILSTAQSVTKGTPNMYQAAIALQDYLRTFTYNAHNPNPPAGVDATVWFLNRKEGFCTFFASAMALMGRSLGMPTRIVSGYTNGTFDEKTLSYVVHGTQAHTWTQIYFGQYGWINFEPTASFTPFYRPQTSNSGAAAGGSSTPNPRGVPTPHDSRGALTGGAGGKQQPAQVSAAIHIGLAIFAALLAALIGLGLLWWWWRSRFRAYTPIAASFARLILLGVWAGAPPQPAQTPREYARRLARIAPEQREALEQVGALYSRDRWGAPLTETEQELLPSLYERGRLGLVNAITRRLRQAPARVASFSSRARTDLARFMHQGQ